MNLHEYQAKSLLSKYNVPVLQGRLALTPEEAEKSAIELGGGVCVVKAQVHAGGRGKAGGVKLAKTPADAKALAKEILGMTLVTPQTGAKGKLVRKVWIEQGANIAKEFYLSLIVDRANCSVAFVVCKDGGVEIEQIAHDTPEKILNLGVSTQSGFQAFHGRVIGKFLGLSKDESAKLQPVLKSLYTAFLGLDCSMLEINPLMQTAEGEFICLDAKVAIDDNALFRQPEAKDMMDPDEEDPRELEAGKIGISYIALEGNIGCMVNGAGLAMATMDIIKQAGGQPANFLDVGGGANKDMVREAFKLILQDESVEGVLVNIFGGIMRCDVIAEGIIEAAKTLSIKVPLVVRLEGTNVEIGKKMLKESGLKIIPADDMADAATKIVEAVKPVSKTGGA